MKIEKCVREVSLKLSRMWERRCRRADCRGGYEETNAGVDMKQRENEYFAHTCVRNIDISTSCFWLIVSSLRLKMFLVVSVWIHRHFKNLTIDISVTFLWNVWHICLRHWYEMWHFRRCKIFSISMQSKTSGLGTQLGSLRSWIKCRIRMKLFAGRASWSWADVLGQVNVDVQLEWSLLDRWKKDGNQGHNLSFIDHNQNISFAKHALTRWKVFLWISDWFVPFTINWSSGSSFDCWQGVGFADQPREVISLQVWTWRKSIL